MSWPQLLEDIYKTVIARCEERDVSVDDKQFVWQAIHLLSRDTRRGILKYDVKQMTICRINTFIDEIIKGLTDPLHTTMINMKITYFMKSCKTIDLDYVKELYDKEFKQQLKVLIDDILQYPETCNQLQLDQLFKKMQIFVIVAYKLGCPKNHVLLTLMEYSLNSVIGRSDIQNYVLKKKYHRLEYLQRLSATVAGILIFNNIAPDGDYDTTRDVVSELQLAVDNTKDSIDLSINYASVIIKFCQDAIDSLLEIDMTEKTITYRCPIEKLQQINDFIITYSIHLKYITFLRDQFEKTKDLFEVDRKQYECVYCKISETMNMRTAIDSELIFPHFVYLSQVWIRLHNYLNHIVELNKVKDTLEAYVPPQLEELCRTTVNKYVEQGKNTKYPQERTFFQRLKAVNSIPGLGNFCKLVQSSIKDYCAVTLLLTNGLLLPAKVHIKLCKNQDISFGFRNNLLGKYAERYFEDFIISLKNALFTNANVALLLNIADEMISQNIEQIYVEPPKSKDFECQTEMVIENDLSVPNWINVTWNVWDYHRETIHLADIRKRQTHDSQTNLSYGQRNAQNQTYNARQK